MVTVQNLPIKSRVNRLPLQFRIIIPSTIGSKPVKNKVYRKRIADEKKWFDKHFGGDTSLSSIGSYWNGKKTVNEKGTIIESSMSVKTYNKHRKCLASRVKQDQKKWKQDTVLYGIEGTNFIYPFRSYIDHDKKLNKKRIIVV